MPELEFTLDLETGGLRCRAHRDGLALSPQAVSILQLILGVTKIEALAVVIALIALTSAISTLSGLWGVLVTDAVQFVIKMGMVIVLAVVAVDAVGGIDAM